MKESVTSTDLVKSWRQDDVFINNIPAELVSSPHWLVARRNPEDEYRDKQPISPSSGFTNTARLLSFETAIKKGHFLNKAADDPDALLANEWAVLGFVLTDDDPFVFVDWDDIRVPDQAGGRIPDLVRDEITNLGGYVEVSTSGTGFHQFVRAEADVHRLISESKSQGSLPIGALPGLEQPHIEVYNESRYAVTTGDDWTDSETGETYDDVTECTGEFSQLMEDYLPAKSLERPSQASESTFRSSESDKSRNGESDSLLQIASNRAQKKHEPSGQWLQTDDPTVEQVIATGLASSDERFNELWHGKTDRYPTRSEADCSFVSKLWYYADDRRRVDEAFRRSALMREKWLSNSYRKATLRYTRDNARHDGKYLDPTNDSNFSI